MVVVAAAVVGGWWCDLCCHCIRGHSSSSLDTSQHRLHRALSMTKRKGSGPSSASQQSQEHIKYGGSRCLKDRFRYANPETRCGFVELALDYQPTSEQLFELLQGCPLVERVEWQRSKTSQGNVGKHESEQNIKVFPKRNLPGPARQRYVEFEVTRYGHMRNVTCPRTVTIMFKDPTDQLVLTAWAILREICKDKELFPAEVEKWYREVLQKYRGQRQWDDLTSGETCSKRTKMSDHALANEEQKSNDAPLRKSKEEEKHPAEELGEGENEEDESEKNKEDEVDWGGDLMVPSEIFTQAVQTDVPKEMEKKIREEEERNLIRNELKSLIGLRGTPELVRSDTDNQTPLGKCKP